MDNIKFIITLMVCSVCFQMSWSQTIDLQGKVTSVDDIENIHIINKTSRKFTITNKKGEFVIPAKLNDTLIVSSIQNKLETILITMDHVLSKKIAISLEEHINELDEVIVGKYLSGDLLKDMASVEGKPITSLSLGIPSYQGPLKTQNERILYDADHGVMYTGLSLNVNKLLNTISGRTKKLKTIVKLEKKEVLMYKVKTTFSKDLFEENPLPQDKVMDYFYFVSDAQNFTEFCNTKSDLEILVFLKEKLKKYKTIMHIKE